MPYQISCPSSGFSVVVDCACHQVGHDAMAAGAHHERCMMNNLTANLPCTGSDSCCGGKCKGRDCEDVANSCQGGHGDCPEPDSCQLHQSYKDHYALMKQAAADDTGGEPHAFSDLAEPPEQCPGGHCHKDIEDCKVHHPIVIAAGLGSAVLRPVAGGVN